MNKILVNLLLILLFAGTTLAQECGPSCPVCSGAGNNDGALLARGSMMISGLSIPTADEETTVLKTRYGVLNWLDAGVGYAFRSETILWNVRTQLLTEKTNDWRPGLILGTGSVQTGGSDQSVYVQFIKSLEIGGILDVRLSVGAATLVPDFDEVFGQAGITTSLYDRYTIFANYDGESFHEGISWTPLDWLSLSFLMVETEYPAFSIALKR
ncbi:MAG: hypothetical protein KOO62_04165 [candidate division Zixibacteria bacterium]|nr:hypothetical protein [candidate division Zixibacteria bacterium]